jgi:hypothetical protein
VTPTQAYPEGPEASAEAPSSPEPPAYVENASVAASGAMRETNASHPPPGRDWEGATTGRSMESVRPASTNVFPGPGTMAETSSLPVPPR